MSEQMERKLGIAMRKLARKEGHVSRFPSLKGKVANNGNSQKSWELSQQGKTQNEISEILGITPGAVSSYLYRLRRKAENATAGGCG